MIGSLGGISLLSPEERQQIAPFLSENMVPSAQGFPELGGGINNLSSPNLPVGLGNVPLSQQNIPAQTVNQLQSVNEPLPPFLPMEARNPYPESPVPKVNNPSELLYLLASLAGPEGVGIVNFLERKRKQNSAVQLSGILTEANKLVSQGEYDNASKMITEGIRSSDLTPEALSMYQKALDGIQQAKLNIEGKKVLGQGLLSSNPEIMQNNPMASRYILSVMNSPYVSLEQFTKGLDSVGIDQHLISGQLLKVNKLSGTSSITPAPQTYRGDDIAKNQNLTGLIGLVGLDPNQYAALKNMAEFGQTEAEKKSGKAILDQYVKLLSSKLGGIKVGSIDEIAAVIQQTPEAGTPQGTLSSTIQSQTGETPLAQRLRIGGLGGQTQVPTQTQPQTAKPPSIRKQSRQTQTSTTGKMYEVEVIDPETGGLAYVHQRGNNPAHAANLVNVANPELNPTGKAREVSLSEVKQTSPEAQAVAELERQRTEAQKRGEIETTRSLPPSDPTKSIQLDINTLSPVQGTPVGGTDTTFTVSENERNIFTSGKALLDKLKAHRAELDLLLQRSGGREGLSGTLQDKLNQWFSGSIPEFQQFRNSIATLNNAWQEFEKAKHPDSREIGDVRRTLGSGVLSKDASVREAISHLENTVSRELLTKIPVNLQDKSPLKREIEKYEKSREINKTEPSQPKPQRKWRTLQ